MLFSVGDIVMLKDINKYDCTYYHKLNLFKISEVMPYGYILNAINEPVKCDEIIPVPIDGIHDRNIIFRTSTVAYMTTADGFIPEITQDMRYYKDSLRLECIHELLANMSYVHEVQKLIKENLGRYADLEIDNY